MNTKKADWSRKPAFEEITLHSYRWNNTGKRMVFFTLGESESCALHCSVSGDVRHSFMLFHTPSDYILFSEESIDARLFGSDIIIPHSLSDSIELRKDGPRLSFYSEGRLILSTENPVFTPSASMAFIAEGDGSAYLEVF